tara:strand:- start:60 stop:872 length:813 start_codon:yes stop_codon:yes gene_type:complete
MKNIILITFFFLAVTLVKAQTEKITHNIYFKHSESIITTSQKNIFWSFHNSVITNNMVSSINIFGYCNELGGKEYNAKLSKQRAQYIYKNIDKETIWGIPMSIEGFGKIPNTNNETIDDQLINNRKVIITYTVGNIIDVLPSSLVDIKEGEKMILKNILFANGWYKELLPESTPTLQRLLTDLKQNKKYHIQIRGHIFDIRNYDENAVFNVDSTLSKNRAKTVYKYLVDNGIDSSRLSYIGLQGKYPLYKEEKDDRRVEIEVTKIELFGN